MLRIFVFSLFFSLSLAHSLLSTTYAWEDYDDFSGSILDTSKWEAVYFAGGQEASIESGKAKLFGSAYYSGSPTQVPSALSTAVAESTEGNAGILISDSTVFGIEVELTLPLSNNSYEAGVFLDIKDTSPLRGLGHEIRYTSSGTSLGYSFLNTSSSKEYSSANASLDTAHKITVTKINGKMSYFLDGSLLKEFTNNTYDSDYWLIGAFNDNGSSFVAYADNVRVLRQASTTSLDGSIFTLSSTDGVSETMSFENGTFTSSFVDSQKITTITNNQSYILDSMSSNSWKITLSDGDVYSFDSSAGTGTLTDYENGVIDTRGSWNFTYTRNTWMDYDDFSGSTLDTTKWEVVYWAGGETVTIVNGQAQLSGSAYSSSSPSQMPSDFANAGQDATSGNTALLIKDATIIGLEADIMIPNAGNQNEAGIYLNTIDSNPLGSLGFELRKTATGSSFNYDYFNDQGSKILGYEAGSLDTFHKIKMTELNGQTSYYLDNKLIKQFASTSHDSDYWGIGSFSDNGMAYTTYADNVRVLRNWEDYDDFSSDTLDASKWDISYYGGGKPPAVENGVVKLSGTSKANFNEFKIGSDFSTNYPNAESDLSASGPHSNVGIANANLEGIEFEVMIPSSVPSETGVGLYVLNTQELGNAVDSVARANATKAHLDLWYSSGNPQIGLGISGESTVYIPSKFNVYYRLGILFGNSTTSFFVDGEKKAEFTGTFSEDYLLLRGTNENDVSFDSYLDNVRVLRRSTTATQPDPVTVVSDPNGQAVVVQVGEKYNWNSSLDGVTLWGVEQSGDGWSSMTMRFENGRNFGNQGFFDSVAQPQPYDAPYEIDENGYIKSLEDDGDYQYYNPVSVENGVIGTIQNDEGVDSVANNGINQVDQWFFTTRAAAEEYYYSKVNPKDWMWFDHYPWVYSSEMQEWLYFYPSGSKLLYYSNKNQAWREFSQ